MVIRNIIDYNYYNIDTLLLLNIRRYISLKDYAMIFRDDREKNMMNEARNAVPKYI